jgi:hypothetical protein
MVLNYQNTEFSRCDDTCLKLKIQIRSSKFIGRRDFGDIPKTNSTLLGKRPP